MSQYQDKSAVVRRSKEEEYHLNKVKEIIKIYNDQCSTNVFGESYNMVELYLMFYRYYYGKQENNDYAFMEQIAPGVNAPAKWVPGQKVSSMIDYMRNTAIDQIKGYKVVAKAIGKETVKKREELFRKAELELELRPVFDKMAQMTGISYEPIQGFRPNTKDDIAKFKNDNYKERAAEICRDLATHVLYQNNYRETLPMAFFDAVTAGPGCIKVYAQNGHVRWKNVNPIYGIKDTTEDSDLNRFARFAGEVRWMTMKQILHEYDLTPEQARSLEEKAGSGKVDEYSIDPRFPASRMLGGEQYHKVYDVEWIDVKDLRFETNTDEYGNQHYVSTKRKNLSKKDREVKGKNLIKKPVETVRQGTLIMDCELVQWGERTNQVRSMANLSETQLSYHWFMPGMRLGQNVSIAQRLKNLQDKLDLYDYIEQLCMANHKGVKFTFDVSKLEEGKSLHDVYVELQTMGIIPYDSTQNEEGRQQNGKLIERVDLTLDEKTVNAMEILKANAKAEMEEVVSIPKIAQGMQTSIVGKAVQENTIARSTIGTLHYYDAFIQFVNKILLYSANLAKILYTRDGKYEGTFIVGDNDHRFLEISKDMLFEDFDVSLDVTDKMDEQSKARILQAAMAAKQNGEIDMLDYLIIEESNSYSEAKQHFKESLQRKKAEQMQQMQMQLQNNLAIAQQRAEATQASQLMNQVGQNNRAILQNKSAIIQEGMRQAGAVRDEMMDEE